MNNRTMTRQRLDFLDNLRLALTVLVIYHHTSIPYGGEGNWAYISRYHGRSWILSAFNVLAQTFFMGAFFFISGIFSRIALNSKGPAAFLKAKSIRVVLPTVAYTLVAGPVQRASLEFFLHGKLPSLALLGDHLRTLASSPGIRGPVWYCALLFMFDCMYAFAFWQWTIGKGKEQLPQRGEILSKEATGLGLIQKINTRWCIFGILSCSLSSFFVRLIFPVTYVFPPLNLRIGYVPQYMFAYSLGTRIDPARVSLLSGHSNLSILTLVSGALAVCLGLYREQQWTIDDFSGGLNGAAAIYSILNEAIGYLLLASFFELFRRRCNFPLGTLAKCSYASFLMHAPVSITLEAALDGWKANGILKMVVVGWLNSVASFAAAWLLRRTPAVRQIL